MRLAAAACQRSVVSTSYPVHNQVRLGNEEPLPLPDEGLLCRRLRCRCLQPLAGLGRQHLLGLEGLHRRADGGHARLLRHGRSEPVPLVVAAEELVLDAIAGGSRRAPGAAAGPMSESSRRLAVIEPSVAADGSGTTLAAAGRYLRHRTAPNVVSKPSVTSTSAPMTTKMLSRQVCLRT